MPAILALTLIEDLALLWRSKRLLEEDAGGPMEVSMVTLVNI